jgi:hypothetical protein
VRAIAEKGNRETPDRFLRLIPLSLSLFPPYTLTHTHTQTHNKYRHVSYYRGTYSSFKYPPNKNINLFSTSYGDPL